MIRKRFKRKPNYKPALILSKVENDQKALKREHLKTISKTFNCSFSELEALWIGSKVYDIVKDEKEGMSALKVAEEQIKYEKKNK